MATITKRVQKSGVSYRIQVKMRDKGSGKTNTYSTTWKPPAGLTARQIEREVIIYADQYENELKMSLTAPGTDGISPDTTLASYAEWWIERRKNEVSASYYMNCKNAIKDIVASIGGYKLRELNPTIIQRFYDQLDRKEKTVTVVTAKPALHEAMKETNLGFRKLRYEKEFNCASLSAAVAGERISLTYANRLADCLGKRTQDLFDVKTTKELYAFETIHKTKRTLRAILASAKKQRIIADNYASADYINFPKRPTKEIDYMNDDDAKKFYAAADAYPDIDFEQETITIKRSVTTVAKFGVVEKEPKTESSKRTISISNKLITVLQEYKAWYDQYRIDMGDRWNETDRLVIAEEGKRIYPGTVYNWVHKICDAAELPHRTVHSLRHTNITMQIAAGVPLVTVSGRAGHARASTTTDVYSHFLKSSDKTAAEALEKVFE